MGFNSGFKGLKEAVLSKKLEQKKRVQLRVVCASKKCQNILLAQCLLNCGFCLNAWTQTSFMQHESSKSYAAFVICCWNTRPLTMTTYV